VASQPAAVWNEVPRHDVARDAARLHDAVPNAVQRRASAPARLPVWQARILLRALRPVSSTDLSHPR